MARIVTSIDKPRTGERLLKHILKHDPRVHAVYISSRVDDYLLDDQNTYNGTYQYSLFSQENLDKISVSHKVTHLPLTTHTLIPVRYGGDNNTFLLFNGEIRSYIKDIIKINDKELQSSVLFINLSGYFHHAKKYLTSYIEAVKDEIHRSMFIKYVYINLP